MEDFLTGAIMAAMDPVMWVLALIAFYFCRSARDWALAFVLLLVVTSALRVVLLSGWTPMRLIGAGMTLAVVSLIGFAIKSRFSPQPRRRSFEG